MLSSTVFYAEIEPLDVSFGICIDVKEKVKLTLLDFDDAVEIAPFEKTIENPLIIAKVRVHTLESPIEKSRFVVAIPP